MGAEQGSEEAAQGARPATGPTAHGGQQGSEGSDQGVREGEAAEREPDDPGHAPAMDAPDAGSHAAAELRRPRGGRRVTVPGTGPASADGPEAPVPAPTEEPGPTNAGERERDRWLKEQKPPHWG